jgi:hypothetical protein
MVKENLKENLKEICNLKTKFLKQKCIIAKTEFVT